MIYKCYDGGLNIEKRKKIMRIVTRDMAKKMYYGFLIDKYLPEVMAIENGNVGTVKIEDFKKQLVQRIKK